MSLPFNVVFNARTFLKQAPYLNLQVLEDEAARPEAAEHRYPDVHPGLIPVRSDSPVRFLAFWLGPEHRQGAALPLLRQERYQVHHQVAGVAPAAHRVQAPIQDAHGWHPQAESLALCIKVKAWRSEGHMLVERGDLGSRALLRGISNFK